MLSRRTAAIVPSATPITTANGTDTPPTPRLTGSALSTRSVTDQSV